jgi:polyhydroxyalkanoate synthesis regulator phasin
MSELRGKNYSVYFNRELVGKFENVQNHLGKGISQALAHLVEAKDIEIRDGLTRRDQIAGMREDIAALTGRVTALESLVGDLVEELKR